MTPMPTMVLWTQPDTTRFATTGAVTFDSANEEIRIEYDGQTTAIPLAQWRWFQDRLNRVHYDLYTEWENSNPDALQSSSTPSPETTASTSR